MNRPRVNVSLKQASDLISRDLQSKRSDAWDKVRNHSDLNPLKTQIEKLEKQRSGIEKHLSRSIIEPVNQEIAAHNAAVKEAREEMNWAITPDEKLAARKKARAIIDRAQAIIARRKSK